MYACPLLLSLSLLAQPPLPAWYSGRHAVLIVVDGLGDQQLTRVEATEGPLLESMLSAGEPAAPGTQRGIATGLASCWPGRGGAEIQSISRARRSLAPDDSRLLPFVATPDSAWQVAHTASGVDNLLALHRSLPEPGSGDLPPILAVVHERRYADTVRKDGVDSPEARRALSELANGLKRLQEAYRKLDIGRTTVFALISPAGIAAQIRQIEARTLLHEMLPSRGPRTTRLNSLLRAFSSVRLQSAGNLAVLSMHDLAGQPRREEAPDVRALWQASKLSPKQGGQVVARVVAQPGIAWVGALDHGDPLRSHGIVIHGRAGKGELEVRDGQLRYRVLTGRDPLALGILPADLTLDRFHADGVWRSAPTEMADALPRIDALFRNEPGTVLVTVAAPGYSFASESPAASWRSNGSALFLGSAPPAEELLGMRSIDVMPTLLATVGAPLPADLEGTVLDPFILDLEARTLETMAATMLQRARSAFSTRRAHDASVVDTSEVRRFGTPPPYFTEIRSGLGGITPESLLPELQIRHQIGPRRSLLHVATALSARVEQLVLKHAPREIRRYDPLLRPQLLLAGFLTDPRMRSNLLILEGPAERELAGAAVPADAGTPR